MALLAFLVLVGVALAYHCDEARTEAQCGALLASGIPCKWEPAVNECNYVNCGKFRTNTTCGENVRYGCEWRAVEDTLVGQNQNLTGPVELCYSNCPANKAVVFVADISSSVVSENATADTNVANYRRFLAETMDLIWKVNAQAEVPTKVAYALVVFARTSLTIFEFNREYTLEEYLRMTEAVIRRPTFEISPSFNDNTNTTGALETALAIVQKRAPVFAQYSPMVVTVTDGRPNLPFPTSPCSPSYDIDERFKKEDAAASFVLVGFNTTVFNCFLTTLENHASVSRVEDFGSLADIVTTMQTTVCPATKAPTLAPTPQPTLKPTARPTSTHKPTWSKPTPKPTWKKPSPKPTWHKHKHHPHPGHWHPHPYAHVHPPFHPLYPVYYPMAYPYPQPYHYAHPYGHYAPPHFHGPPMEPHHK